MFSLLFIGMAISLVGKLTVIGAALIMHGKVVQEKKIDDLVLREYKKEKNVVIVGAVLLILGFAFEVVGLGLFEF